MEDKVYTTRFTGIVLNNQTIQFLTDGPTCKGTVTDIVQMAVVKEWDGVQTSFVYFYGMVEMVNGKSIKVQGYAPKDTFKSIEGWFVA